jgi:hypothetical protein
MAKTNTKAAPVAQAELLATTEPATPPPEVAAKPTALQVILSSRTLIDRAKAFPVTDAASYEQAVGIVQELRLAFRQLEAERKEITQVIDASKAKVMAFFNPSTEAITAAAEVLKSAANAWDAEQRRLADVERRRVEEQARLAREETERKARAERAAAEAEAQKKRDEADRLRLEQEAADRRVREQQEAEAKAKREAEDAARRGDEEAAKKARDEQEAARKQREADELASRNAAKAADKLDRSADVVEAKGEQKAAELEVRATTIVAPVVETQNVAVRGVARRTVWKFEVTDPAQVQAAFKVLDLAKIQKTVNAMHHDAAVVVGGIRIWEEQDLAIGAKK